MFFLLTELPKDMGVQMQVDLTDGRIGRSIILFSLPMIVGNLLQQLYNIADTLIVGRTIGAACTVCSRFGLCSDGSSDFCFTGTLYGKRRCLCPTLWA